MGDVGQNRVFERFEVVIPATLRSRSGFRDRVTVYDISCGGCLMRSQGLTIQQGDIVVVRPEGIEGLGGEVRWVRGRDAGIRFLAPLYGPVVDHLHRTFASFMDVCSTPLPQDFQQVA